MGARFGAALAIMVVVGSMAGSSQASLAASVSSPAQQFLPDALRHGVRARVRCSAACSITARVTLSSRQGKKRKIIVLGTTRTRLRHGRPVSVRISIRSAARRFKKTKRTNVAVQATASTTGYYANKRRSVSVATKPVTVRLSR